MTVKTESGKGPKAAFSKTLSLANLGSSGAATTVEVTVRKASGVLGKVVAVSSITLTIESLATGETFVVTPLTPAPEALPPSTPTTARRSSVLFSRPLAMSSTPPPSPSSSSSPQPSSLPGTNPGSPTSSAPARRSFGLRTTSRAAAPSSSSRAGGAGDGAGDGAEAGAVGAGGGSGGGGASAFDFDAGGPKTIGEIQVELSMVERSLLEFSQYIPLIKLILHEDQSALRTAVQTLGRRRRDATPVLANIVNGLSVTQALRLVATFIRFDLESISDLSLLFRVDSVASRTAEGFMRREGNDYRRLVLLPIIQRINESVTTIEIDPTKIGSEEDLATNTSHLIDVCRLTLRAIFDSADKIPRELRALLRMLANEVVRVFPIADPVKAVAGIFFLRFFGPAIISPATHNLPTPMSANVDRTLTLLVKVVQKLANFISFDSIKEDYMLPLNAILEEFSGDLRTFMLKILDHDSNEAPLEGGSRASSLSHPHDGGGGVGGGLSSHRLGSSSSSPTYSYSPSGSKVGLTPDNLLELLHPEWATFASLLMDDIDSLARNALAANNLQSEKLLVVIESLAARVGNRE